MVLPWGAIVALVIYVLGSTFGFVWWMATITEQLKSLSKAVEVMSQLNNLYSKKEDMARELGVIERNQETMWAKFDKLKEKVDSGMRKENL